MLSTTIFAVLLPSLVLMAVILIHDELSSYSEHASRGLRLTHTQSYFDHNASFTAENSEKKHLHHHQKPTLCPTPATPAAPATPSTTLPLPLPLPLPVVEHIRLAESSETRKLTSRHIDYTALKDNSAAYSDNFYYGGDDAGYYAIPSSHAHEVATNPCTLAHSLACIMHISDLCNNILINEDDADYYYITNLCEDPQIIPTLANYEDVLAYLHSLRQREFENKEMWLLETALIDSTLGDLRDGDDGDDDDIGDDVIYATWRPPLDDRFKWDDYYYSIYDDDDELFFEEYEDIEIASLRRVYYNDNDYDDYYSWIAALDDYPVEDDISAVAIAHTNPKDTSSPEAILPRARALTRNQREIGSRAQLVSLSYDYNTNNGDQNQTQEEQPFNGDLPLEFEHGREDDFDDINIIIDENPPSNNDPTAKPVVVDETQQKKSFSTDIYKVALFGGVMFISSYIAFRVLMNFRSSKFEDNAIVPGASSKDRGKGRNSRTDSDFSEIADVESEGGDEANHYSEHENMSNYRGNGDPNYDNNRRSRDLDLDLDLGTASYRTLNEITPAAALPVYDGNNYIGEGSDEDGRDGGDGGDFSSYLYNYFTNNTSNSAKNALPIAKHTYSSSDSMGTISHLDMLRHSIGSNDKYSSAIDLQSVETIDGSNHYSASTASSSQSRGTGGAGGDAARSDGVISARLSKLRSSLQGFNYKDMPYESDEDIDEDQDRDEECTESSLPSSIHSNNSDITNNSSSTASSFGSRSNSFIASSANSRSSSSQVGNSIGGFKYGESAARSNVKYNRI